MKSILGICLIILNIIFSINPLFSQNKQIWGVNSFEGKNNGGFIYKLDTNGNNYTKVFEFNKYEGDNPYSSLFDASNGIYYGSTLNGGEYSKGVLFKYDANNDNYEILHHFNNLSGYNPYGTPMIASNGKIYGTAYNGGNNNNGVVYEYDLTSDTYTAAVHLDNTTDARRPKGKLTEYTNGRLFFLSSYGGVNDKGAILEYNFNTDSLILHHSFNTTDGELPQGSLIKASNGLLYGMTTGGGTIPNNPVGVLFSYNPITNSFEKRHNFDLLQTGRSPYGDLIEYNSYLYGLSYLAGSSAKGNVFKYDLIADTVFNIKMLDDSLGRRPFGSWTLGPDSNLYAMTYQGGTFDKGTIIKLNPSNDSITREINFSAPSGSQPRGSLVIDNSGMAYGMTFDGGITNSGNIFKFNTQTKSLTSLIDFNHHHEGYQPNYNIIKASDGYIYGTTAKGGNGGQGILYKYHPTTSEYGIIKEFHGMPDGQNPLYGLIEASDGNIYGTAFGGSNGFGLIYKFDVTTMVYSEVHTFDNTNGRNPNGAIAEDGSGNIYGVTFFGGQGYGVLYSYNIFTNIFTNHYNFAFDGNLPQAGVIVASNGKVYGTTTDGGVGGNGVLFEFDPISSSYSKINTPANISRLMEASNGNLYGVSNNGGAYYGFILEYKTDSATYQNIHDFNLLQNGRFPNGALIEIRTNTLLGVAGGGTNNKGIIYEYNLNTDSFKAIFNSNNSISLDNYGSVFITNSQTINNTITISNCESYTSPSGKYIWTNSGTYTDTLISYSGIDSILTINLTINQPQQVSIIGLPSEACAYGINYSLIADITGGTFSGNNVDSSGFTSSSAGSNYIYYEVIDSNMCIARDTAIIDVKELPNVNAGSDTTTFHGGFVNLNPFVSGGSGTYTYSWAPTNLVVSPNNKNTATTNLFNDNTFSLTVTDDSTSCINTDAVDVFVSGSQLSTSISANKNTICEGENVIINSNANGGSGSYTYTWVSPTNGFSSNSANINVSPANTATYYLTLSDGSSFYNDSITITVNQIPSVSINNSLNASYCNDDNPINLTATPTGGIFSGPGITGNTLDFSQISAGNIKIQYQYTDINGCSNADSTSITVYANPVATFTSPTNYDYCFDDDSVQLVGSPAGGSFSGTGVTGIYFHPDLAQIGVNTLYYDYTDANGCAAQAANIYMNILPLPSVQISTNIDSTYCDNNSSINLSANPSGGTFSGNGVSGNTINFSSITAGNQSIIYSYTDANGCANSDTVNYTLHSAPTVIFPSLTDVCANSSQISLNSASPSGGTYSGNFVNSLQSAFYPQIANVGNHEIIYNFTDVNGCTNSDTANQKVISVPTSNFTVNSSACINDTVDIVFNGSASLNATYNWNFDNAIIISGNNAGPYEIDFNTTGLKQITLSVTDSSCSSTTTQNFVNIQSSFAYITAVGNSTACYGDSVTLFANTGIGYSYQWFDTSAAMIGDTLSYINIGETGDYYCEVTAPNSCASNSNTISVTIKDEIISDFNIAAEACKNDTVNISFNGIAPNGSIYNWNFDNAIIVSGSGSGPYQVYWTNDSLRTVSLEISEGNCISNITQKNIQIQTVPATITVLGGTSFCDGDSASLLANTGNSLSYVWKRNNQLISGANQSFYNAKQSGAYRVEVTNNSNYCVNESADVNIVANSTNFGIDFTASQTNFNIPPFNTSFTNNTSNPNDYYWTWYFGDGNSSTLISPSHTYSFDGTYTIGVIAENISTGCIDTLVKNDYITASGGSANPCTLSPSIIVSGSNIKCPEDSIMLKSNQISPSISYQWLRDGILLSGKTDSVLYAKNNGMYQLMLTDSICTQFSNPVNIAHYPSITPIISSNGSIMPCTNDSMELYVNTFFPKYEWSNGDTTANIFVKTSNDYTVTVTDANQCKTTSNIFTVNASLLQTPEICIVGVDSNNNNRIIWERNANALIDSFRIYRESVVAGQYTLIGSKGINETGIFIDTASNPEVRAYRYKITAVDTCGMETPPSPFHKSIHLTINAGLNGSWNLIWDGYYGFNFGTYKIYRGSSTSNMSLLTQLPSTSNSYTDLNPPSGTVFYQIEVIKPDGCYPDSVFTKANVNYNSSRSNTAYNGNIAPIYLNANFTANSLTGQWPIQVSFTDISSGNPTSWKWSFGDGNSSIEKNPKHTYNNTGLYDVKLIACNGNVCDTTIKQDYINVLPNGIVEVGANLSAKIYPNPNDGSFTLEVHSKRKKDAQLFVYNNIGQLVYSDNFSINNNTVKKLDLSTEAKGVYFVHLSTDNGIVYREKVVVQ